MKKVTPKRIFREMVSPSYKSADHESVNDGESHKNGAQKFDACVCHLLKLLAEICIVTNKTPLLKQFRLRILKTSKVAAVFFNKIGNTASFCRRKTHRPDHLYL